MMVMMMRPHLWLKPAYSNPYSQFIQQPIFQNPSIHPPMACKPLYFLCEGQRGESHKGGEVGEGDFISERGGEHHRLWQHNSWIVRSTKGSGWVTALPSPAQPSPTLPSFLREMAVTVKEEEEGEEEAANNYNNVISWQSSSCWHWLVDSQSACPFLLSHSFLPKHGLCTPPTRMNDHLGWIFVLL